MRRLIASIGMLAFAATLLFGLFGCSHRLSGVRNGNMPPKTIIFVQGPVDTVNHLVHLYWYGTDTDGYVTGYEIKLVNPEDTVAADSAWHVTTRTDTLVAIYTPQGHASPTFYARAIDNAGDLDPNIAVQKFNFSNRPPFVTWKVVPRRATTDRSDTTYAAVSVSWTVSDPDGELAYAKYRVWLDGREATPDIVTGLQYTVPSDRFLVNGQWPAGGTRTLYLQAIDDGGMAGNTISTSWYVRRPVDNPNMTPGKRPGRLLIIDDLPANHQSAFMDTMYTNTAARNLPPGTWSVLSLDSSQPFRTWQDLAETMNLFDAVVWYRGAQDSVATVLQNFQPALGTYLQSGGKLYIDGLFLIQGLNAEGALTTDFVTDYLDCTGLRNNFQQTQAFLDSTGGWGNINGAFFVTNMFGDTLRQQQLPGSRVQGPGGIRVFNVKHVSDIALVAAPGGIIPAKPDSLPVGVSVPQPSGGRAVVITLPYVLRGSGNGPRVLAKIFAQLGLVGP